jgi:diacylglycerol kinase (ATP)
MKTRLIVNPTSGRDKGPEQLPDLNERLRAAFADVQIVMTVGEGDGERAARRAAEEGCRLVVAAGGDGTLNEVLNGVAAAGALDRTSLGVVPLGTGNDFAGLLGLPEDPTEAVERLVSGHERRVDLGTLNGRVFVNASAGGFLAEVSDSITSGLKTVAGRMAYVIAGASVLVNFEPPSAEVQLDDEVFHQRHYQLFVVSNGQTIGGGHRVAPGAKLDDGLLDAVLVDAAGTAELVQLLRRMSKGEHLEDERVTYRQFRTAQMSFDRVIKVNTDGEVRESPVCRYGVMPLAARFLY